MAQERSGDPAAAKELLDAIGVSLEESNNERLQRLNSLGAGVQGINDGLVLMLLEELVSPSTLEKVKRKHQEWLAEQLDGMETLTAARYGETTIEDAVKAQERQQSLAKLALPGRN